jgi:hypothetical protein
MSEFGGKAVVAERAARAFAELLFKFDTATVLWVPELTRSAGIQLNKRVRCDVLRLARRRMGDGSRPRRLARREPLADRNSNDYFSSNSDRI